MDSLYIASEIKILLESNIRYSQTITIPNKNKTGLNGSRVLNELLVSSNHLFGHTKGFSQSMDLKNTFYYLLLSIKDFTTKFL